MESEFLLVWVHTVQLHLAVQGGTPAFVNSERQWESRGQGHAPVTAQNKAQSQGTGLGILPQLPLLFLWPEEIFSASQPSL